LDAERAHASGDPCIDTRGGDGLAGQCRRLSVDCGCFGFKAEGAQFALIGTKGIGGDETGAGLKVFPVDFRDC
jgi:hypothetical protein